MKALPICALTAIALFAIGSLYLNDLSGNDQVPISSKQISAQDTNSSTVNLANTIMENMGFQPENYIAKTIEDDLPYEIVQYYFFELEKGQGKTRPVIYVDSDENQYLIVFQEEDGKNVIKEITLTEQEGEVKLSETSHES